MATAPVTLRQAETAFGSYRWQSPGGIGTAKRTRPLIRGILSSDVLVHERDNLIDRLG